MKKSASILLILLLIVSGVHAQGFAPIGAKWHYSADNYQPPWQTNYILIESIKDTFVLGQNAKKIESTMFYGDGTSGNIGNEIIYSNGNKVYLYRYNQFRLLYDFDAMQGDTIHIVEPVLFSTTDTLIPILIDSVKIENIGGQMKKVQYVTNLDFNWVIGYKFIESVGSSHYLLPIDGISPPLIDSLRCYTDNIINYSLVSNCTYLSVSIPKLFKEKISIPSIIKREIKLPDLYGRYIIYDLNGSVVKEGDIIEKISLETINQGIYIIQLKIKEKQFQYKFIKI